MKVNIDIGRSKVLAVGVLLSALESLKGKTDGNECKKFYPY